MKQQLRQDYAMPLQCDYLTFVHRILMFSLEEKLPHLNKVFSDLAGKEYQEMPDFKKNILGNELK